MKLHLGCGQVYLDGYVNIDYPVTHHSVQSKSVADEYHDITTLRYHAQSIEEIRLHHVFEHFPRAKAAALLCAWHTWLTVDGKLTIEVPDFDRTALQVLNPFSSESNKFTALRHIFGSQEADWAVHFEGWSKKRLISLLSSIGYEIIDSSTNSWKGTFNFRITGKKTSKSLTKKQYMVILREYLSMYQVDRSDSEMKLLEVWMSMAKQQLFQCFAQK